MCDRSPEFKLWEMEICDIYLIFSKENVSCKICKGVCVWHDKYEEFPSGQKIEVHCQNFSEQFNISRKIYSILQKMVNTQ